VPAETAEAVRLLEAAGYANAGKTNLHEFAYGTTSENEHFGAVPNPHYPGHVAGGSSGGSAAAIAAGDVELALGTDSGGSIRIPAAWCGITGFKPTYGLVPAEGCFPLAPSYDHVGPICATVQGCSELMHALVPGLEPVEITSLADLEVGFAWLEHADPLVRARVDLALECFPHRRALDLPLNDRREYRLFMREAADVHRGLFPERADEYGENVRTKMQRCLDVTDEEVAVARRLRAEYHDLCDEATDGIDLLVTPTIPFVAPPADVDELTIRGPGTAFTYPFSALGWPALALPPYVQLVGRSGDDGLVLAAGKLLASLI